MFDFRKSNITTGPGRTEIPQGVICEAYRGLDYFNIGFPKKSNITTGPGRTEVPQGVICEAYRGLDHFNIKNIWRLRK